MHAAFRGIRGGVGTTSTVAALGNALQAMGETVLMIDLAPENLLRLHFGIPLADPRGWATEQANGSAWDEAAREIKPGLHLLPFGQLGRAERSNASHALNTLWEAWPNHLAALSKRYGMILVDLPMSEPAALPLMSECELRITTMEADPASCALLHDLPHRGDCQYLITRFDPLSHLQRDIRLLWQDQLGNAMIQQVVHRDEAIPEALGQKQPVGDYRPQSLAAQDAANLASWCRAWKGAKS